ncbi:MAG TPA: hypothetical protein VHV83_17575 [Armatimonadota bacterium]|nr:hypothetical protein [Armatimonadota bacterium]
MIKRSARLARLTMMTPTSLLRTIVLALGVMAMLLLGGCRKPAPSFNQELEPQQTAHESQNTTEPPTTSATEKKRDEKHEAITVVTKYLTDLKHDDFNAAYELLSQKSKEIHNISDFEQQGKQGMPSFDLKSAKATIDKNDAIVTLQQLDDPATHDFNLVREDDAWKIVYRGGVPGMPYAE